MNLLKWILSVFVIAQSFAQAPQKISYQTILRHGNGMSAASLNVKMRISIHKDSASGITVFSEIHDVMTTLEGRASLIIGTGTPVSGALESIDWSLGNYYIQTEADFQGGSNYSVGGVSELLSVPYALYAENSKVPTQFQHYIGELFGGGIIVSLWKENGIETGLIASLTDLATAVEWSTPLEPLIGKNSFSDSNGRDNTKRILELLGARSSAAKLCADYTAGGFNDWYLPSISELKHCRNAALVVNEVLGEVNGFRFGGYWSSSMVFFVENTTSYFYFGFHTNLMFPMPGDRKYAVRAIRKF